MPLMPFFCLNAVNATIFILERWWRRFFFCLGHVNAAIFQVKCSYRGYFFTSLLLTPLCFELNTVNSANFPVQSLNVDTFLVTCR